MTTIFLFYFDINNNLYGGDIMTIEEYLTNPTGRSDSAMMFGAIRQKLDKEFSILQNAIRTQWYFIDNKAYIVHLKIPSSTQTRLFYDVLVEFKISAIRNGVDYRKQPIRVFSNCPSFTYTYARVFYQQNLLIPWTAVKYDSKILGMDPDKRNPGKIINYEKSLYFAFRYLYKHAEYFRRIIPSEARTITDQSTILNTIMSDQRVKQLFEKNKKYSQPKKIEKSKQQPALEKKRRPKSSVTTSHTTKKTKKTKSTKTSKRTKHF